MKNMKSMQKCLTNFASIFCVSLESNSIFVIFTRLLIVLHYFVVVVVFMLNTQI